MMGLIRYLGAVVSILALATPAPALAQQDPAPERGVPSRSQAGDAAANEHTPGRVEDPQEPEHIRGQVTAVDGARFTVRTADGRALAIGMNESTTVLSLSKSSFAEVDFGVYVGAVAVKLEEYSPIVRDSAVWLHKGFELRIIDDNLRGIALGHRKWDLTPETIISHGWVDDIEVRVLSIKWGPTDYDETDVEVPRNAPVQRMSLGDRSLVQPGRTVFVGARKAEDGRYEGLFVMVGKDGTVPAL